MTILCIRYSYIAYKSGRVPVGTLGVNNSQVGPGWRLLAGRRVKHSRELNIHTDMIHSAESKMYKKSTVHYIKNIL